ncbi:alpha/beta hydrolase [Hymenobacter sp. GOD-10R]|uniref:alpha/beta fold hydrolase n=1 Tax=Hymenobacter sp. GOD-10R TaxID=3093922 RepID=UPI002D78FD45|nr:alpha/beta hydrolase [Hymenobacter sp. GOD-10R]WRQ31738.1 alpha/beta hydrolase [Hymenobacter sp. GOD-10R]
MATPYAPEPLHPRGQTVALPHLELYYEEYGTGKPLLLLHGFGGCTQNWLPFTAALAEHYRLLLVDLPGHGYSTNPQNQFSHRAAARDVLLLLDQLGVEHCSAMGMSSGAMTLLHLATSHPERLDALVLVSATTHFPEQARAIMRAASLRTLPPPVLAMYRECAKRGEAQLLQLLGQFNALADDDDDMNFTPPQLAVITARTLVVHGERDRFFPVDIARTLSRSIPNAQLWLVPGGEHVPIYERTVPFTATALRFLQESAGQ